MTVRGTTAWQHAKIQRQVINHDNGGQPLICMWMECDRRGYENYKHTACMHDVVHATCEWWDRQSWEHSGRTAHTDLVFCSERHRTYFVASTGRNALELLDRTGLAHGNLPPGMRGRRG